MVASEFHSIHAGGYTNVIVISKSERKKIVNDKVKDKENKEWTATSLLYRWLNDFKSTGINLKTECPWWDVAK